MADIIVADYGGCQQEAVGMGAVENPIEVASVLASVSANDAGAGADAVAAFLASIGVSDTGLGLDTIQQFSIYFYVDPTGTLNPLGIIVLRDSRHEVLPRTREYTEEIPGRHGEIDFGAELEPRVLELHCTTSNFSPEQRGEIKRKLAQYLNPLVGEVSLVFWDEIDKVYWVRYSGQAEFARHYANWLEFTIPLKGRPFLVRMWEKRHVGSGELENEGTADTPLVIEIQGPVTNPQVTVGSAVLSYTGTLTSADRLVIDTENMTVTFNGQNAIASYSGTFPWLPPGKTQVVAASSGTTTFRWRDRWL